MNRIEWKWWRQRLKNVGHYFESWYYVYRNGYPAKRLEVIGVTGTDGKTTTTTLVYEILKAAKYKAAMISTVNARYVNKAGEEVEIETGLHTTNPSAKELQPLIKTMVGEGVTHLVLEVTAHGIDQHRIVGCNISIGVLTNVTRDHLDDFITIDRYKKTKLKMFLLPTLKFAVLNKEDSSFEHFKKNILKNTSAKLVEYGKIKLKEISPSLTGDYNQYNIGAALAVSKILDIETPIVNKVVKEFGGVPGRREEVKVGQPFKVLVDFAHTPNALEQVLKSLAGQKARNAQLIVMFGCTGERDSGKRPMMGRIAVNYADKVIITSDDTRGENQEKIYSQIAAGIPASMMNKVIKENDRRKAIQIAVGLAKPGDMVLLAGKGHEKTINLGNKEYEWNDVDVVRVELSA